jgi:hypothetical protein
MESGPIAISVICLNVDLVVIAVMVAGADYGGIKGKKSRGLSIPESRGG